MNSRMTNSESAPLEPTGNPLLSNMGPAAYANRANVPDHTYDGRPRIVPLRADTNFFLSPRDPDPRGMTVVGADGGVAGSIVDVWVDRAEPGLRYFEVQLANGSRHVLLPAPCGRIKSKDRRVQVKALLASQFADVPGTAVADRVTLLEEDMIQAYFAGGYLYATPSRQGPLI